jgi:hypothetical protein
MNLTKNRTTLLIHLFLACYILPTHAQTPSNCQVSAALQQNYKFDVYALVAEGGYIDTVNVTYPDSITRPYWNDLAAIANAGLPASHTVFDEYCIHISPNEQPNSMYVQVTAPNNWSSNWAVGNR